MNLHLIQKKYEFLRIIERIEDENILIVITNIREVTEDLRTGKIELLSLNSHSEEYPLHNIPKHIQSLAAFEPTQISPMQFLMLKKLYKNDIESFLHYNPNKI